MKKVVFLDRDGVLNRERGEHTFRAEDFEILPDVVDALLQWKQKGYEFIVVTNQSGISRGLYDHKAVIELHDILVQHLAQNGIELLDMYYCPHLTELGKCLCRKPESLLFEKAIARHGVDVHNSVCIGDKERDIFGAEKAGIRGILIASNSSLLNVANQIH